MDRLVQEPEVNPLDDVAKSLHDVHMFQPKCWVWEFADDARIVMDKEEIHPAFRHRLIPLYTRAQLARAKGEEYDYEY